MKTQTLNNLHGTDKSLPKFSLQERATYSPASFNQDELINLMAELDAWRSIATDTDTVSAETPEYLKEALDEMTEKAAGCNNEEHSNFDDYKQFFEACVNSLEKRWPCAEPWDQNLCQVIYNAIAKGDALPDEE